MCAATFESIDIWKGLFDQASDSNFTDKNCKFTSYFLAVLSLIAAEQLNMIIIINVIIYQPGFSFAPEAC